MVSIVHSPEEYVNRVDKIFFEPFMRLREIILKNIPDGFIETIQYGMITFVVPHTLYPAGYHADPSKPLPFISIAAQKNHIALYHMGIYANKVLLDWFTNQYILELKSKPDMGKSCIRFKKNTEIPYNLIGELVSKITPKQWIELYKSNLEKK